MRVVVQIILAVVMPVLLGFGCAGVNGGAGAGNGAQGGVSQEKAVDTDLRRVTEHIAETVANAFPDSGEERFVAVAGLENRTQRYLDSRAFTVRLRSLLAGTGRVRPLSEADSVAVLSERNPQDSAGKARHMVTGIIMPSSRDIAPEEDDGESQCSYSLVIDLVDLDTGVARRLLEENILRKSRLPLVGW